MMARLIDADAAKLTVNDYAMFRCQLGGLADVVEFLNDMPTVDAVEVVRCKDCKWLYDGMDDYCCRSHRGLVGICENSFCSYGERKDGDGNG